VYAATDAESQKKIFGSSLQRFDAETPEGQFELTTEKSLADELGSASSTACDVFAVRRATTCA
jgi:hypothetical protein